MAHIDLFTGASCPTEDNEDRDGGWCYIIHHSGMQRERYDYGYGEDTNLDRMHMLALREGLRSLKKNGQRIMVFTDCLYMLECLSKPWFAEAAETGIVPDDPEIEHRDIWVGIFEIFCQNEFKFARVRRNPPFFDASKAIKTSLWEEFQGWNGNVFDYGTYRRCQETSITANTLAYFMVFEPSEEDLEDKPLRRLLKSYHRI